MGRLVVCGIDVCDGYPDWAGVIVGGTSPWFTPSSDRCGMVLAHSKIRPAADPPWHAAVSAPTARSSVPTR
ncbi:MAG: hypothetical protein QOG19_2059 [Mycobacterium sp.]|nr:hypothetical protein [Mycobacterium sp.]